jgi:hypothetical protein
MKARSPPPQPTSHERSICGAYSHPDCGSAANGVPSISYGFHSGTCPEDSARPIRHDRGSQNERMSGFWFVRRFSKANPRSAMRTAATINAGPASIPTHRALIGLPT